MEKVLLRSIVTRIIFWITILMHNLYKKSFSLIIISLVYLITFSFMLPLRNVGYDDDFAYINTAEYLFRTGELKMSEWGSASMIFQTYWGVLFAKIFGYSIKILIFSNVVLLYFALISFYLLLKRILQDEKRAMIFTLFLLGFPWVLNFTYSFMSDVFYMSLLIISSYFYVVGLGKKLSYAKFDLNTMIYFFLGSLFAGFAFLDRQIGIAILLSAIIVFIYESFVYKKFVWQHLSAILIPALIMIYLYFDWLGKTGPTVAQDLTLGSKFREDLIISLWPQKAGFTSIVNNFYFQSIQRLLGFFGLCIGLLLPVFLIFSFKVEVLLKFIKNNFQYILFFLFIIPIAYYLESLNKVSLTQASIVKISEWDIFFNLDYFWKYLVFISIPIWSIIIAVTYKFFYNNLFADSKIKHARIFIILLLLLFTFTISHFFLIFQQTIVLKPHFVTRLTPSTILVFGQNSDILPTIYEILQETWLFFLVVMAVGGSFAYMITHKIFLFNSKLDPNAVFLGALLILELSLSIIGGYYYWQNYIIQFIPLIIIWLAYFMRKNEINYRRAVLVAIFLIFLSLEITRNRYQTQGAAWEVGTKVVNMGYNITNITTVSWAWRPYWLFEENLAKAIKEEGGNKYKIGKKLGGWEIEYGPGKIVDFLTINPNQTTQIRKKEKVLVESDIYWTFKGIFKTVAVER